MAADKGDPWVDKEFEQAVRQTAYLLWKKDCCPEGAEKHYWFKAIEKCIRRRQDEERLHRGLVDPM